VTDGYWKESGKWNDFNIDYKVEVRPRDTLSAGRGWGVISSNIVSDFKVDYLPRDTLTEGRGWWGKDWIGTKHYIDYEVDYLPHDTLSEGRGWWVVSGLEHYILAARGFRDKAAAGG
jgi:predicted dithiol-disulfide oxidoreductase (DUF899 family)